LIPVFDTCCLQQSSELRLILLLSSKWYYSYQNIMAKKVFVNRERAIPSPQTTSESREEITSTSRYNPLSEQLPFMIVDETSNSFPKFNATGCRLLIKFNSLVEVQNPGTYLKERITALPCR